MKLSLVAAEALSFVYIKSKLDYSKYTTSINLVSKPIVSYTYMIDNIGKVLVGDLIYKYLKNSMYIESTNVKGDIIHITLNQKYFDDLTNKQEI